MSWQAAEWLDNMPYAIAKPLATRVLLKLANVAAQDGTRAWRNIWEVADELGVDRKSVQRALRELEAGDLIRPGDQRAVAHIRADRRPTVYDLNFGYARMYAQAELPLPESDVDYLGHGATELLTGPHGATNGAARSVPLGTNGTTTNPSNKAALVLDRAQAHKTDGFAAAPRPASASTAPFECPKGHFMVDATHCEFGCPTDWLDS